MRARVLVAPALIVVPQLGAQGALTGVVRGDSTGTPLAGVEVVMQGTNLSTRSDSRGRFILGVAAGRQVALFRMLGFRPSRMMFSVADGDTVLADVRLVRQSAQELEAVEVSARPVARTLRESMIERQKLGFGKFLDSTQLRRMEGRMTMDVIRGLGVKLQKYADRECPPPYCMWQYRAAHPTKTLGLSETPCYMTVMLDGMFIYRAGSIMRPPDFSREFPVISLEAIEYYRSTAQLPQELGVTGADCGVLVLWSRK